MPEFKDGEYKLPHEQEEPTQELEIEIEDDTPVQDRDATRITKEIEDPDDEELSSYSKGVQSRIRKMTLAKNTERRLKDEALREREAAEAFAKQVYEENKKLKSQLESGSKIFIDQHKNTAQMEMEDAKKRFKHAFETGDSDELATAQEAMSKATLKLDRAETMQPIESPDIPYEQPKPRLTPKTQEWVESNSDWWGKNEEMTMTAMGIDKRLQREYGADYIGTEEYFKTIDETMRKRFPEHFDALLDEDDEPSPRKSSTTDSEEQPQRRSKMSTVVAPATRSTPPNRIRLKTSEATIARRLGVTLEEYARQAALIRRRGE